jgi:hypothetical protein
MLINPRIIRDAFQPVILSKPPKAAKRRISLDAFEVDFRAKKARFFFASAALRLSLLRMTGWESDVVQ